MTHRHTLPPPGTALGLVTLLAASGLFGCQMISKQLGMSPSSPASNTGTGTSASPAEPPAVADRDAPVGNAPDWCKGYIPDMRSIGVHKEMGYDKEGKNLASMIEGTYDRPDAANAPGDWDAVAFRVAARACELPNDPMIQAQTAKWRKAYIAYWGLTARDFNDYMFAAKNGDFDDDHDEWCKSVRAPKDDIEAGVAIRLCGVTDTSPPLSGWYGGDLPNAPVVMSLANLPGSADRVDSLGLRADSIRITWLRNLRDLENLDRNRLEAEIKAYPLARRVRLREHFRIAQKLAAVKDKALASLDPVRKKLLDAGRAADKAWMAMYAANKPEIDLAMATLSRAAGGKDLAGCGPKLRAAYKKALSTAKVTTNQSLWSAINRAPLSMITRAMTTCMIAEGDVTAGLGIQRFLASSPYEFAQGVPASSSISGPREAAMAGAIAAYATLRPQPDVGFRDGWDFVDGKQLPDTRLPSGETVLLSPPLYVAGKDGGMVSSNAGLYKNAMYGTVASVEKAGAFHKIVFKKEKSSYNEINCRTTNEITGIDDNGDFRYRSICSYGRLIKVDTTFAPVTIRPEYMAGIAPGKVVTFALYSIEADPKAREAFPLAVHADAKRTRPAAFLGAGVRQN